MKFTSSEIYAKLTGNPICRIDGSGDSVGADEAPERAPANVDIFGTLYNGSPNLDISVKIDAVADDFNSRVHFLHYLTPATSASSPDNVESILHICHDMLNDESRIHTSCNLKGCETDFDAANISRSIRTVFPAMTAVQQNEMAQGLGAVEDSNAKYTGTWARLISLSLALDAGLAVQAGVINALSAGQQIATFAGAATPAAMLNSIDVASQGGNGVTFLPVDAAPTHFTDPVRRVFAAISQATAGITIGPNRRSLASLFDNPHDYYFYGSATRMNATPFAAAALTVADVSAAMRFLMSTTGDVDGLNDALGELARRVRFFGPNITNLATTITDRFNNLDPVVMLRFNVFWAAFSRDKVGGAAADALLQNSLDALVPAGNMRARDRDATLGRWGAEHQGLRAIGETMYQCLSVERYLLSLTTSEVIIVWGQIGAWGMRIANAAAPGAGVVQGDRCVNPLPGDCLVPVGARVPSWDVLEVGQSVSSDGYTAGIQVPSCAGVALLKQYLSGTANVSLATNSKRKRALSKFNGIALRRRMYLAAAVIRCAADVVFDSVDSSRARDDYAEGAANTGNLVVDEMLDYDTETKGDSIVGGNDLYSLVLVECGYYGVVTKGSVDDSDMYHYDTDDRGFHDNCVRCCFHPAIAKQFLGDDCGRSGGDYSFKQSLPIAISASFTEVWSNHQVEGMRSSEVAALIQFISTTRGRSILFGSWLNISVDAFGTDAQTMASFMPTDICRPTENRIDASIMTPSLWWFRPIYAGRLKLLSVGQQMMSGYNIIDGLRNESNPNVSSLALNKLYSGAVVVHTGPARGDGRQRWIMRGNPVARPVAIPAVVNGIGRDAAVKFTAEMVGCINKLAAIAELKAQPQPYIGKLRAIQLANVGITIDKIRRRISNDAFGMVKLGKGMKKFLGLVEDVGAKSIGVSDF